MTDVRHPPRHKHPPPTGPFEPSDDPSALAFEAEWMRRGQQEADEIDASGIRCAQCLYSTAAQWFALGWSLANAAREAHK